MAGREMPAVKLDEDEWAGLMSLASRSSTGPYAGIVVMDDPGLRRR
jgi:hypothetical protein